MNLGATIRKYRRKRDITQERFAKYLNVSPQAVSRWETGAAYPDITTIPAIADFLGISTDTLFGVEESEREKQIQIYLEEYKRLRATGEHEKRFVLSKEAKDLFPGDFRILKNYAWELAALPYKGLDGNCTMTAEELEKCSDEVLDVCRMILEDCTDDSIRWDIISLQIMMYRSMEDDSGVEKAIEIANRLPCHFSSKEGELAGIYDYDTEEHIRFHQQYTQDLILSLWWQMRTIVYSQAAPEDKVLVCQKALDLFRLMYEKEDYGFEEGTVSQIYEMLAKAYLELCLYDLALDAIEQYAQHRLKEAEAIKNGFQYSSILFHRLVFEKEDYSRNYTETPEEWLLHYLGDPRYDAVRDTERFQKLLAMLTDS